MAFKKLKDCDGSDMSGWARTVMADNFIREVESNREVALRALIKKPTEENAANVRAFDFITSLFKEAQAL